MSEHKGDTDWQSVAAALNSQLAAERKARDEFRRALEQRIGEVDELRSQLAAEADKWRRALAIASDLAKQTFAAEREKHKGMAHHMEACRALLNVPDDEVLYGAIEELQQQLAAEQQKSEAWRVEAVDERIISKQLRSQLAAERVNNDAQAEAYLRRINELRSQLAAERKNTDHKRKIIKEQAEKLAAERIRRDAELAAEREVGHNQAVTLGQHIARLEDQLATLVDALKVVAQSKGNPCLSDFAKGVLDALAKVENQPVQLPMINDDPVVTLK